MDQRKESDLVMVNDATKIGHVLLLIVQHTLDVGLISAAGGRGSPNKKQRPSTLMYLFNWIAFVFRVQQVDEGETFVRSLYAFISNLVNFPI